MEMRKAGGSGKEQPLLRGITLLSKQLTRDRIDSGIRIEVSVLKFLYGDYKIIVVLSGRSVPKNRMNLLFSFLP